MTFRQKLASAIHKNQSFLCIGLDPEFEKLPVCIRSASNPIFLFNQKIIDQTYDLVCAYKPNLAFYEVRGTAGWEALKKTCAYIPKEIPIILDAKRGDIGNTARLYAQALFAELRGDAVTVNPYLGEDSLAPFFEFPDKGIFVLCLTSNPGARDFQLLTVENEPFYKTVARKVVTWDKNKNLGLVVGATYPEQLQEIRAIASEQPFLIPGLGTQGGDLEKSLRYGTLNGTRPAIFNISRAILYASSTDEFALVARKKTAEYRQKMTGVINQKIEIMT